MRQDYVLGLAFDASQSKIVMIRKTRPAWQAGKLNAIGGKIDAGETPIASMCREFAEETGITTTPDEWHYFMKMISKDGDVFCYRLFDDKILQAKTMEDQAIELVDVDLNALKHSSMSNMPWLVGIALDEAQPTFFVEANYNWEFISGKAVS